MTDMKKPGLGGGRVNSESFCKVKPNTQQGMVLEQLRQRPMSAAELQWALPIADARAVVRELVRKGIPIETQKHGNPSGGQPIQRYHLVEPQ